MCHQPQWNEKRLRDQDSIEGVGMVARQCFDESGVSRRDIEKAVSGGAEMVQRGFTRKWHVIRVATRESMLYGDLPDGGGTDDNIVIGVFYEGAG